MIDYRIDCTGCFVHMEKDPREGSGNEYVNDVICPTARGCGIRIVYHTRNAQGHLLATIGFLLLTLF